MIIPVPALSASGWTTNLAEKSDLLLAHFFESDKAQSYIYNGNITNIQWLIEEYGHNVDELCRQMQEQLERYLGRYYTAAVVDVASKPDKDKPNEIILRVYCRGIDNGKEIIFAKLLHITNTKLAKVISLNNDGDVS